MLRSRIAPALGAAALTASLLALSPTAGAQTLAAELAASGFNRPLFLTAPPGDTDRLFVVEQNSAQVRIFKNGQILPAPFLDLGAEAGQNGEEGLLGLAFHPDYENNGRFFVDFTNNQGNTRVWEFVVSGDPDVADPNKVQTILTLPQPFSNHNGGCLAFGPDGMLYISLGDGGSADDPGNRAQDLTDKHGKLLRLDIDAPSPFIPSDNPFFGQGGGIAEDIWCYGLRNPWRFSFDRLTGDLWIGDVGQNAWEEIDFQPAASTGGENYGWRCMEGLHCTGSSGCTCNDPALVLPIHEYGHGGTGGCSVTGGYVYRGPIAWLQGTYFFGDFCSGRIWSFRYDGANMTEFTNRTAEFAPGGGLDIDDISSFGEDGLGNLYILDIADGEIWRIVEECSAGNYCSTAPNSAGSGALISSSGSQSIADNAWSLHTAGSIPNQFGLYIYGLQPNQIPGGDGFLCIGGTSYRVLPPIKADPSGDASLAVDFTAGPFGSGPSQIVPGQTFYFQWWNRDPGGPGGSGFNFSDGLMAVFCP